MAEAQEMDVEQVMDRIRQSVKRRREAQNGLPVAEAGSTVDEAAVATELARLEAAGDIRSVPFTSHRPVLGWFIVIAKRVLRKLLTPILEAQTAYNAAIARTSMHLKAMIEAADRRHADALTTATSRMAGIERRLSEHLAQQLAQRLTQELAAASTAFREGIDAQSRALRTQSEAVETLRRSSEETRVRVGDAERKLRRILHALAAARPDDGQPPAAGHAEPTTFPIVLDPPFDYAGFEDRFRGSEAEIRERQRIYLRYLAGRDLVLDVGCGRGELLALLRESGIKARGLDVDLDMVLLCRDKGLDVVQADVFAHLPTLPDDSVGAIFAGQVIEHLESHRIVELVKLAHRKLAPGGVLIVETPNPTCLIVFADSFYRDLSHIRPIHPDTTKFLFEAAGFREVESKFMAPVEQLKLPKLEGAGADVQRFNAAVEQLNSLLFGAQDYAVIGRKS